MTTEIARAFEQAKNSGRAAFIPFLTAGYPNEEIFLELILALNDAGADLIEVGLPFSDPLADGPVIQTASRQVLDQGLTPTRVIELAGLARTKTKAPLLLMTYYQPIFHYGLSEFSARLRDAGLAGTIIPDLPLEEAEEWLAAAEEAGLDHVFMVAPTTTPDRLEPTLARARGFLYYVSLTGVTGAALTASGPLLSELRRLRSASPVPVAVGFGVDGPQQAAALASVADGVIVGSALIRTIQSAADEAAGVEAVRSLAVSIIKSLHHH